MNKRQTISKSGIDRTCRHKDLEMGSIIVFATRFVNIILRSAGCRATIVGRNGTITSPAFGLSTYPSNQECLFKVRNPGGSPLSLNFNSFHVDKSDFVQVWMRFTQTSRNFSSYIMILNSTGHHCRIKINVTIIVFPIVGNPSYTWHI